GGIQGAQNAGVQRDGNQNGLVVVPRIANQNGTGNVVVARAEGTEIGNQAMCYNCRGLGHIARNQFGQYAGQVAQIQQGFNAWQIGGIQGAQNAGVQRDGNQNGLVVVPRIANQSGTGNVVVARAEGTEIENQAMCYNCRGLGHIARSY
nr:hypothetical protein [Tanacetum cinerariifolium]